MSSINTELNTKPEVSVVIPSYNRRDAMLDLLADLTAQQDVAFEIIVVDDCSPDDSFEAIANAFPSVRLYKNEKNGGPAVTRNQGILRARAQIVAGFDSDVTVPDPLTLKKIVDTFHELPQAAGLALRLLQPDQNGEDSARWWHPLPIALYSNKRFQTDYFSGTGYAFRRESIMEARMFPEILYMHYEEYELAFRILDTGKTIVYTPNISVVHHEHQISRRSEIKTFYKHRNQILVAIACYPLLRGLAYIIPRTVKTFLSAARHGYLKAYFRALKSARELAPIRLKERSPLQSHTWRRIKQMRKGLVL